MNLPFQELKSSASLLFNWPWIIVAAAFAKRILNLYIWSVVMVIDPRKQNQRLQLNDLAQIMTEILQHARHKSCKRIASASFLHSSSYKYYYRVFALMQRWFYKFCRTTHFPCRCYMPLTILRTLFLPAVLSIRWHHYFVYPDDNTERSTCTPSWFEMELVSH